MFGIGQSVKNISSSTVSGSTYTNTGTKLKMISVYTEKSNSSTSSVRAFVNSESWAYMDTDGNDDGTLIIPVPPNSTWRLDIVGYIVGQTVFIKELS